MVCRKCGEVSNDKQGRCPACGALVELHIRWMIRRDMPEVLAIENDNYINPQSEDDFIRKLRLRHAIGMVGEIRDRVVSYMVYRLEKYRLTVLDLSVCPSKQGRGIGRAMVAKLGSKLSPERRNTIMVDVDEHATGAHLFARACGFRCVAISDDIYRFAYWINDKPSLPYDPNFVSTESILERV